MMPLVEAFGAARFALTLDLPGTGESDPLALDAPTVADYAAVLKTALAALDIGEVDLYAPGTGAPFAIELAAAAPDRVGKIILDGGFLLSDAQRAEFLARYCPSLAATWEGAHLARAWQMLRHAEQAFPWYELSRDAIRWRDQTLDLELRQARLFDILKQSDIYDRPCRAAFSYDMTARLPLVKAQTLFFTADRDPLYAWADEAAGLAPNGQTDTRPAQDGELVDKCLAFLNA
jgi:pimeloyl-ACP methyl ester carboxylesterase